MSLKPVFFYFITCFLPLIAFYLKVLNADTFFSYSMINLPDFLN